MFLTLTAKYAHMQFRETKGAKKGKQWRAVFIV